MGFLSNAVEKVSKEFKEAGPAKKAAMAAAAATLAQGTVVPAAGIGLGFTALAAQQALGAAGAGGVGAAGAGGTGLSSIGSGAGPGGFIKGLLGAKNPSGMGLEGGGVAEKLARGARAAALLKPTKGEKRFEELVEEGERDLEQERKRLARAKGGFTSDQFRRYVAAGAGQVRSAVAERAAQLARGGSIGVGQSGVQEESKRQLNKQKLDAIRGIYSGVRDEDIQALERQVERFDQKKAEQQQRVQLAGAMQRQAKTQAVAATQPRVNKTTTLTDRKKGPGIEDVSEAADLLDVIK